MLPRDQKLTRDETKTHHQRLALKLIYAGGETSRADIARTTGLTRSAASAVVAELMAAGLVAEPGQGPSAGGKPPTLLRVIADARQIVGIDLAGATLRGCVFDLRGQRAHRVSIPFPVGDGHRTLDLVRELADRLVALADKPLLGIGVGLPGLIDTQLGVVRQAVNLGWQDLALGELLAGRYGLPVYLLNDSQAAALAEYTFANLAGAADLAVILVEQGVSAGLVFGGQLYRGGGHCGASEIGHVRAVEGGELCACGHFGCLETVAGQRAILRWARTIYLNQPDSLLHQTAADPDRIDMAAVVAAYQAGDPALAQMVAQLGRYLGSAAANLVAALNVPLVVLAGSVAQFGAALAQAVKAEMVQRSFAPLAERTEVRVSALGDDAVMLGAAALLLANELGAV